MHADDLTANIATDASDCVFLLKDVKGDIENVARSDREVMREEIYVELAIKNRCRDLETTPHKLPFSLALLKNYFDDLKIGNFWNNAIFSPCCASEPSRLLEA